MVPDAALSLYTPVGSPITSPQRSRFVETPPSTSKGREGTTAATVSSPVAATPTSTVSLPLVAGRGTLSPASASQTSWRGSPQARQPATAPASSASSVAPKLGLLIPTDRPLDDFEDRWLPRLGRLRVDREVTLTGYALYGIRSWYLSRTHWALTIVASTGKPTEHITCYVLVPAPELSESAGKKELAAAEQYLAGETRGHPRQTEHGTLLVSTPAGYGQEIAPIPPGDLREAWPFIQLNTAMRRLGCGGRAAMGTELPVAAVRRKFYESYRIPSPGEGRGTQSRANSPPQSPNAPRENPMARGLGHKRALSGSGAALPNPPTSPTTATSGGGGGGSEGESPVSPTSAQLQHDPLMLNAVELVKLVQGALALWGLYGRGHKEDDIEIDGLFCDETKAGLFAWRRAMGMEQLDSLKLEKETSGGCIDPRTLSALLSSVTSVRYQLAAMGVERLPKDPFMSTRRFLIAWRNFTASTGKQSAYLSVQSVRAMNECYVEGRGRHGADAFKVHRVLLSGVANAASSMTANLKNTEETPLRKREQHLRFRGSGDDCGVGMIVPEGEVGAVAAPDVITTDLDAYIKGVLKTREKDLDIMGARRIAELWNGSVGAGEDEDGRGPSRLRLITRLGRGASPRDREDEDDEPPATTMGTIRGMTSAALKGGQRLVGRRHYDTSDSEAPKPRRSQTVPTLIEPDNNFEYLPALSRTPSPGFAPSRGLENHSGIATPTPRVPSHSPVQGIRERLSVATNLTGWSNFSGDMSDAPSLKSRRREDWTTVAPGTRRKSITAMTATAGPSAPVAATPPPHRRGSLGAGAASDGADVVIQTGGHEWAVANPHGTGKREMPSSLGSTCEGEELKRTQSLQDRARYRGMHVSAPEHLAVDVSMCELVWKMRQKERGLAKRAADMATLERSAFVATQTIFDTARQRRERIESLENEVRTLRADLARAATDEVDDDRALQWASSKLLFFLSEDTNTHELSWELRELEKQWEALRDEHNRNVEEIKRDEGKPWWRLGL